MSAEKTFAQYQEQLANWGSRTLLKRITDALSLSPHAMQINTLERLAERIDARLDELRATVTMDDEEVIRD